MHALAALLVVAGGAAASQFHLPLHTPPALPRPARPVNASVQLALGAFHASGAGVSADGPGGGWEIATRAGDSSSVHFHSEAFAYHGAVDGGSGTRRKTGGMSGNVEVDFARPLSETAGWYAGALANMTVMDVADPLSFRVRSGGLRLEPDVATSFVFGIPAGLRWRGRSETWPARAAAYGVGWLGGTTLFGYTGAPLGFFGGSRRVDPNVGGGGALGVEYARWGLGLEAGGSITAACGDNETLAAAWARLAWRIR